VYIARINGPRAEFEQFPKNLNTIRHTIQALKYE